MVRALIILGLLLLSTPAHAALLYTEGPAEGAFGPGDSFITSVRLDPEDACINAGRVVVTFPKDVVKAVDFSRGGSIFTLWISEPVLDNENGQVVFEAGVPGGYCGRIQGDPAVTNVLGRIVFTVQRYEEAAVISPSTLSELYISDGAGTLAPLQVTPASVALSPVATGNNAWLSEVAGDTTPPEAFTVRVESTDDVFYGNYYAVFSTVDKQSGMSHYEIYERNAWKRIESPYKLRDQALQNAVEIRAVDKAGNVRLGDFNKDEVPERKAKTLNPIAFVVALVVLGGIGVYVLTREHTA